MKESQGSTPDLENDLIELSEQGIGVDLKRIKEDLCAQFTDYREWIREYVVNAYDAGAGYCHISGKEEGNRITILVEDNGSGMDRKQIHDFMTICRSRKSGNQTRAVGRHGIGKLSVAAIPGQVGFGLLTSTGKECWRLTAGNLLNNDPVTLERLEPVPPRGTRFQVTFLKRCSLKAELDSLYQVLEKYIRFLPILTGLAAPGRDKPGLDPSSRWIRGDWWTPGERFVRFYQFKTPGGQSFEAVLGIGNMVHEIYQHRVWVSDRYNLLDRGNNTAARPPHLTIRVDSPDFDLTFGRHCLVNESPLDYLARHLREHILPGYIGELIRRHRGVDMTEMEIEPLILQELAVGLLAWDSSPSRPWCHLPIFKLVQRPRMSFFELQEVVERKGALYIAAGTDTGIDYQAYDTPVLDRRQPPGGSTFLEKIFGSRIQDLSSGDLVIPAPAGCRPELSEREKLFEKRLGFKPMSPVKQPGRSKEFRAAGNSLKTLLDLSHGSTPESGRPVTGVNQINWSLDYLVGVDLAPCTRVKFILSGRTRVVLNLYCPEIKRLIDLGDKYPDLAAHWTLAMCLTEGDHLFPHLSPGLREEFLYMDAMGRFESQTEPDAFVSIIREEDIERYENDFLLDAIE